MRKVKLANGLLILGFFFRMHTSNTSKAAFVLANQHVIITRTLNNTLKAISADSFHCGVRFSRFGSAWLLVPTV